MAATAGSRQLVRHSWSPAYREAVGIQEDLRRRLVLTDRFHRPLRTVAGADLSYERRRNLLFAAVLVFSWPELRLLEIGEEVRPAAFPYIPGLLTFREGPAMTAILERLRHWPDLLVCDGQGIAHPRGLGLAAHLGVLFDLPTIGCAKSRLIGKYTMPGVAKGCRSPLVDDAGRRIGTVLRTRRDVKPVFVSPGHRVGLESAADLVLQLVSRYRLPEVTRLAHHHVNRLRLEHCPPAG
ncbi:MAG: endonuclease V [Deltaproteobacteria bacterium]|nr:endonuclease V [Deltaproteobacteria bacterium]